MNWLVFALTVTVYYLFTVCAEEASSQTSCVDSDAKCALWASQGECQSNAVWMMANCRRSCQSCQGGDRAWKLRSNLTANYDNSTTNGTKIVTIESVRLNHIEIDESKQTVRVFGRMVMSWNDAKITWDKDQWGNQLAEFLLDSNMDTAIAANQFSDPLLSHCQFFSPSNSPGTISSKVLAANYTGQIYLWSDFSFNAPYHFEYQSYPNDYQRICYKFDDKRYFSVRFVVSPEVKNRHRESIAETHLTGWTVEDMELTDSKYVVQILGDWQKNPYDIQTNNCELCISIKRNAVFYLTEMLIPALVNTALTLSSVLFQLSKIQPTVLAFSVVSQILSLTMINTRLPAFTNSTPTILKFAGFNLVITCFLFIVSLLLRKISHSTSNIPPPHLINRFVGFVENFLPMPSMESKDAQESNSGVYSRIAHTINNLTFAFFTLVYILVIVWSFVF
ncbi:ShKT domain and Neurotransmitter-gated ion-channel ligand-binding domain-containing protein [Aphelenchoides besseyi]|nr:ShKT domain and Neurotransmitter-gated ion-channel ligand-binding domain-containing protein [Aphelenchoides besseyi]